ncbi:MAG: hypothetical protein ACKVQU_04665 [Burkholderiales bacterium]
MATQTPLLDRVALRVPRSAKSHRDDGSRESKPLADWRTVDAYVLLGDPGAGKSWSFEDEAAACNGLPIPARDIVANIASTNVGDRTVFIDALDEVRAGASDGRVPFDAIRSWLDRAGRPRFRLSCREADWLGQSDQSALARVAPGEHVEVLHLEPLTRDDVFAVLRHRSTEVPDPEAFWREAERFGLIELFGNPLLLDLTIKAVVAGGGSWPSNRKGIYEAACGQLATETNDEHLAVKRRNPGDIDRLLDDAGLLCALLLLSNKQSWALRAGGPHAAADLSTLPGALQLHDARAALSSKVFTTVAGQSTPRHRSIAEFLAAKALAKRLDKGLPLGRLLALIQGFDGRPVDPLRGLFAWFVVHHAGDRARLMKLDPLGVVLNGDVAALSTSDRLNLLEALSDAARQDTSFRRNAWVSHPFGPLATADMASTYDALLRAPERDDAHQAFMDCVFDALRYGEPMPALVPALEAWVEDGSAWFGIRMTAYEAWKHSCGFQPTKVREWLDRLAAGTVSDSNDRLTGALLTDLYPEHLGPREVFKFLRRPIPVRRDRVPQYPHFWRHSLLQQSRPQDFADLADALVEARPTSAYEAQDYEIRQLRGDVLAAALVHAGDVVATERLYQWLGICLDEHGFSRLVNDSRREVAQWLEARPDRIKAVVEWGYRSIRPNEQGQRFFWEAEQRLHGARLPRDWLSWLLDQAATTADEAIAKYCFGHVASTIFNPPAGFDVPTMEEIERWVEAHLATWPIARQWLQQAWTSNLEDWRGDEHRRQLKYKAQQMQAREERKRALQPYWAVLATGAPPVGVLHQLARAYDERFSDVHGDTPLERVQDFLVADEATADAAIAGIDQVLARDDLPTADEILDTDTKGKYHHIRPAALLAARRIFEKSPETPLAWSDELAQRLVAFYLTEGAGEMPGWYRRLVAQRPALVAPILMRYAAPKLRRKGNIAVTGLWALGHEADHRELARLVLPELLERFPLRASEGGRGDLNRSLLAALYRLDDVQAARIVRLKLAQRGLDTTQRICWLVADLPYRADAAERLAVWIGKNERRAVTLGVAFYEQGSLGRTVHCLPPAAVRHLIEVLAPITPYRQGLRSGVVTVSDHRSDTVLGLFNALSSNPNAAARDALRTLGESSRLGTWKEAVDNSVRTQQSVAREALFQAADPVAVALVIANLAPANAADLLALVVQHLQDIEAELRGADTYLVRQFWQKESTGDTPHDENFCRDLLLSKLRDRLKPLDIHVERESSAAGDKRADMRAEFMRSGRRIAVPIEVKKENRDKLWTAWRDQLERLYTIDPAAGGYGLYVVLWFGYRPRATPEGVKPRDASHMRELMVERIPEPERHRLAVQVLDLSLPTST